MKGGWAVEFLNSWVLQYVETYLQAIKVPDLIVI